MKIKAIIQGEEVELISVIFSKGDGKRYATPAKDIESLTIDSVTITLNKE